jgi:hypothetical protein
MKEKVAGRMAVSRAQRQSGAMVRAWARWAHAHTTARRSARGKWLSRWRRGSADSAAARAALEAAAVAQAAGRRTMAAFTAWLRFAANARRARTFAHHSVTRLVRGRNAGTLRACFTAWRLRAAAFEHLRDVGRTPPAALLHRRVGGGRGGGAPAAAATGDDAGSAAALQRRAVDFETARLRRMAFMRWRGACVRTAPGATGRAPPPPPPPRSPSLPRSGVARGAAAADAVPRPSPSHTQWRGPVVGPAKSSAPAARALGGVGSPARSRLRPAANSPATAAMRGVASPPVRAARHPAPQMARADDTSDDDVGNDSDDPGSGGGSHSFVLSTRQQSRDIRVVVHGGGGGGRGPGSVFSDSRSASRSASADVAPPPVTGPVRRMFLGPSGGGGGGGGGGGASLGYFAARAAEEASRQGAGDGFEVSRGPPLSRSALQGPTAGWR